MDINFYKVFVKYTVDGYDREPYEIIKIIAGSYEAAEAKLNRMIEQSMEKHGYNGFKVGYLKRIDGIVERSGEMPRIPNPQ